MSDQKNADALLLEGLSDAPAVTAVERAHRLGIPVHDKAGALISAAPAIPQSGETPPAWDSAELPAPVPPGVIAPSVTAHLFAPPPPPSANQLILHIRAGLEQLEWCVPTHDRPWSPAPTTHALMTSHAARITRALDALLSIPTAAPAPIDAAPPEEIDNVEA